MDYIIFCGESNRCRTDSLVNFYFNNRLKFYFYSNFIFILVFLVFLFILVVQIILGERLLVCFFI